MIDAQDVQNIKDVMKRLKKLAEVMDSLPDEARDYLIAKNDMMTIPLGTELLEWAGQLKTFLKDEVTK